MTGSQPTDEDLQQQLRAEREFTQSVLDNAQVIILLLDAEGRVVSFNRYTERLTGYALDEIRGRSWFSSFLDPDDGARIRGVFKQTVGGADTSGTINAILTRGGERRTVAWSNKVLRDDRGEVTGVLAIGQDITGVERTETELERALSRMSAIVENAAEGVITIDEDGVIQSFNAAAERIFGYEADEVTGGNVSALMPAPHADEHADYVRRYVVTGDPRVIGIGREVTGRRKDGSNFPMRLSVGEFDAGDGRAFAGIVVDLTQRRELEMHVADAGEAERRRLAVELHDTVGSQLSGTAILADLLRKSLDQEGSEQAELAAQVLEYLRDAHTMVRKISRGLLPVDVDGYGLMAALKELTRRSDAAGAAECAFSCDPPVTLDGHFASNHLFRIADEAVQNALQHSGAARIEVSLDSSQSWLTLTVRDDGVGLPESPESGGMGLRTMRYRAGLIGARLTIEGGPDGGTIVRCVLPRGEPPDEPQNP